MSKLIIFFSLTFIVIFAAALCLKFLYLRVDWAKSLPPRPETVLTLVLAAAHWALSLTLFSSIMVTLNYVARKRFPPFRSIVTVMLLSFGFSFGVSFVLHQWSGVPPAQADSIHLDDQGIILSNSLRRNSTAVILLEGTANLQGPRVVSTPGQPLAFHETLPLEQTAGTPEVTLPPIPFVDDTPWFLRSLSIDLRLNAEMLQDRFSQGFMPFLIYAGSLIFLLCSLGFVLKITGWPLANLFLAMLAFRGILEFATFFNSPEIEAVIYSFLNNLIPVYFAFPLILLAFGVLINVYSVLVFIAKKRDNYGY